MNLNPEQQQAVDTHAGAILAVAAPGSGKTTVITDRVSSLLAAGVDPRDILSTTFTVEGATEMRRRIARKLLGVSSTTKIPAVRLDAVVAEKGLATSYGHHVFATFHSFALRVVKKERHEHFPYLADAIVAGSHQLTVAMRAAMSNTTMKRRDLELEISVLKRKMITPKQALFAGLPYAEEYAAYQRALEIQGVCDYDDLITMVVGLLQCNAQVRARWQFRYLQVDEAQDTDTLQWTLIQLLSQKHGNLFLVGDENQGMYSWRGAICELERKFLEVYPEGKVLILPENYRSTKAIVEYCKSIAPIKNATVENFRTNNEEGTPPEFVTFATEEEQADIITDSIFEPSQAAVLARTNSQVIEFADACMRKNIKYQILGKNGFWKRYEVENAVAYVRCLASPEPTLQAVTRAINAPYNWTKVPKPAKEEALMHLGTTKTPMAKLREYRGNSVLAYLPTRFQALRAAVLAMVPRMTPDGVVKKLFDEAGILTYYRDKSKEEEHDPDNNPEENIQKLVRMAARCTSLGDFLQWVEKAKKAPRASPTALTLSTIHRAKGLQWPTVYVTGVTEGKLPHIYGDPAEEARIYFVACSRPEKRLVITAYGNPSEFFNPPGQERQRLLPPPSLLDMMEEL